MVNYFNQMGLGINYEFINQGMKGQLKKMDGYDTMLVSILHLYQSNC